MRTLSWGILVALAGLLVACSGPAPATGPDRATASDAKTITWSDGKPAHAISCMNPGGCQERALAMCKQGNYTTLASENMPTVGTYWDALGKPSVVIRCA